MENTEAADVPIFMASYKADLSLFGRRGRKELWREGRGRAMRTELANSMQRPPAALLGPEAGTVTLFLHTYTLN